MLLCTMRCVLESLGLHAVGGSSTDTNVLGVAVRGIRLRFVLFVLVATVSVSSVAVVVAMSTTEWFERSLLLETRASTAVV